MSISSSPAATSFASQQAQTRTTLASEFVKQNAQSEANVANIVESSADNLKKVAPSGLGQVVDRSV